MIRWAANVVMGDPYCTATPMAVMKLKWKITSGFRMEEGYQYVRCQMGMYGGAGTDDLN